MTGPRKIKPFDREFHRRIGVSVALLALVWTGCARYDGAYHRARLPSEITRISPQRTRKLVQTGKALLVCAYADELSFGAVGLEGAISLQTFTKRHPTFPRNRLVIFY